MNYLFLLIISIKGSMLFGQAQFSPALASGAPDVVSTSLADPVSGQQSASKGRLQLTYMGQPLHGVADEKPAELTSGSESADTPIEHTSTLLDSINAVVIRDSLTLMNARIESLRIASALSRQQALQDYLADIPSILPVRIKSWAQYRVSSGFGLRWHPIRDMVLNHSGIDLPQPMHTPVYATADGVVDQLVYQPEGLGLAVYLRHESGYTTVYGHLADHILYVGELVSRGQPIGRVGMSGLTTGPHLHYSILEGERPVDPLDFCFLLVESIDRSSGREEKGGQWTTGAGVAVASRLSTLSLNRQRLLKASTPPQARTVFTNVVLLSSRPFIVDSTVFLPAVERVQFVP